MRTSFAARKHVFADLQPYCCTTEGCSGGGITYPTTRTWVAHENQHNEDAWLNKMCLFCGPDCTSFNDRRTYFKHVSSHLQEIALAILPRTTEDSEDDETPDSDDSGSSIFAKSSQSGPAGRPKFSQSGLAGRKNLPLLRQLEDGQIDCGLAGDRWSGSRFIPESLVYEVITKDSIAANLSFAQRLRFLFSPTNSLADRIHSQARKVFAILALIGQEKMIGDLIYNDNITDEDLPLFLDNRRSTLVSKTPEGHIAKELSSFRAWDERRVRDFLEKQWLVLAPILDGTGEPIELTPNCPLPIIKSEMRIRRRGMHIYEAWLHPAHYLWSNDVSPLSLTFSHPFDRLPPHPLNSPPLHRQILPLSKLKVTHKR